jgi:CRISPR system Cascade subunit CasC
MNKWSEKTMFLELHVLQNFAPSCLNRDESNAPKDCTFGDFRRARISSQCIKHSMRGQAFKKLLKVENLGTRTLNLIGLVKKVLVDRGKDESEATTVVTNLVSESLGLKLDGEATKVLLFLGKGEVEAIAKVSLDNWDLLNVESVNKKDKQFKELGKVISDSLNGQKAADIALFGRMIAEMPEHSIDAAAQVAHAISTNELVSESDFFTALDEAKNDKTPGASMMNTVEFNSACYYRYANVDLNQLSKNLQCDAELVVETAMAFIKSFVEVIPTGKQNSMAAQNPPSFVYAVLRDSRLWSLANAFQIPIRAKVTGLVEQSITALASYWGKLAAMYGTNDVKAQALITEGGDLQSLEAARKAGMDDLLESIKTAITA